MKTARVVAVMLDGTKHETVGVFMALSDRVAFERRYNLSILEMARVAKDNLNGDGMPTGPVPDLTEERTAFFAWRALSRDDSCPVGTFDDFVDGVEALKLEMLEGELDPTTAAAEDQPPATSPSLQ